MLENLANVTVSNTAVIVAPRNGQRRKVFLVQTSANAVRIGAADVTATTGYRLGQNERIEIESTEDVYAIREGGADGTVCGFEISRR